MRRLFLTVAIVISLMMTVAVAQKVEVTFWEGMSGNLGTTLKKITDLFNSESTNVHVNLVYVGSGSDLDSKLLAGAETQTLPTMAQAYPTWAAALVSKGVVTPMDEFEGFSELSKDIYPSVLNIGSMKSRIYGLPFNQQVYLLFYRPLMFEEAGLNPPKTMDELAEDAKLLTVKKDGAVVRYGLGFRDQSWIFTVIARQFGGGEYMRNGKLTITSTANIKAMNFLLNLVKSGYAYTKSGYFDNELTTSSVAMIIGGAANLPFDLSDIAGQKDGIKMTAIPVGPKGKVSPVLAGELLLIFNTSSESEQKAAWEYSKFLLSPQIQMYWAIHTNYSPLNVNVLKLPEWKNYVSQNEYGVEAITSGLENAISYAQNLSWWNSLDSSIGTALSDTMHSYKTPEEALEWAQQQAQIVENDFYQK